MVTLSADTAKSHSQVENDEDLKVADAVWVGTALLHEKTGRNDGFSTEEIVSFVQLHRLTKGAYKSIWQHVNQHCVANRKPQPNRICMLFATGQGNRRLYRPGDESKIYPGRKGAPTHPDWDSLPKQYQYLRDWYEEWTRATASEMKDPLLELVGTWSEEPADEYVARLRENWGDAR
ncbi:MAG: hypothetical protein ABI209_03040 [Edaphobacter sp.]